MFAVGVCAARLNQFLSVARFREQELKTAITAKSGMCEIVLLTSLQVGWKAGHWMLRNDIWRIKETS